MIGRSIFSLMVGFVIFGAGSESVLGQTSIAVPAKKFCVDSGINVSRGDSLQFSASGQGSYGYEGSPVNSTPLTNPDGDRFVNGVNIGKKDDPNAIYKGFIGGLVGKVGANGNYFFIGSNNQLSMSQSGRLFLCYNDVPNSFNNNTGGYRVSINRISDPNQQNTAGRSPSPSKQSNTGRSQQLTRCVKWSTFTQGLTTTSGGRGGIWLAFNELPDGFKQGCIFFLNNNAIDVAYVLKDGIEPSTTLSNGHFYNYYGGVPAFGYDGAVSSLRGEQSQQSLEDLMRRGQALMITWLTPTNGSIPYLNSIPRGRAFVRDDGMVCFSTVCMKSSAVSNQELARILEAGQNLNTAGRSPSPSQQTQTGRSQELTRCVSFGGNGWAPIYTDKTLSQSFFSMTYEDTAFVEKQEGNLLFISQYERVNFIVDQSRGRNQSPPGTSNPRRGWVATRGLENLSEPSCRRLYELATVPQPQISAGRSPSPSQQTTTGRSPASNQQTATRTVQPVRQTFSSVKSLGMAQFLWESTELKSAQETLQKAARGEYNTITNGQKIDFFEEGITEIRPVDCRSFGFSCESKEITYADYLNLKLKVYLQIGVFKNGMKVYDEIPKYQNRLFQDRQYGGLNVGQNLTSEWDKRWNNVKEQQRLKDEQANLPITERLGVVMEQTIKDTANFSVELFKTSAKVAATLAQIKDLAETITSLTSINQYNLNRIAGGPKYTIAVKKILEDSGKALQSFDTDKINELTLKAAQETIELINAQDRKVAGSANVIKIYFAAKDIIDKNKLLRQPQATNALDEFDRFYIAAAMYSKAVDVIIGGLSIPFSEAKVVDTLLKKADAVNTVLFEALEFTYKDSVRRQYVRLQYAYNRNQIQVAGLSSFIDYAAEEVGKYLLNARPDIVTRRPDGTIAVSVDGVVYPP